MKTLVMIITFGFIFTACDKDDDNHSCYDPSLVHDHACTTDCPGFQGCDGVTYCNSCEASRHGIGPA